MKNKLILFDWGNIVESHTTGYSCYNAWDDLFLACGYTGRDFSYSNLSEYRLSCKKTIEEFKMTYNQILKDFNLNTTFEEFCALYKKTFDKVDYYPEVAKYETSLKDKCYIGIFSNLNILDKERLDKQVDLSKYDYVFLSYEMESKKPEFEIFEKVQNQLSFEPNNILFIDDKKVNIETAKKIGWETLMATGLELEKIKRRCEEFINQEE